MKGELTEVNLVDLIQVTCHDRTPSHLAVRDRDRQASLFFDDGELVHAELGSLYGEEALAEVLKWSEGSFELEKRVSSPARTLSGSSVGLLLAAMERIDHESTGRQHQRSGHPTQEIDFSDEDLRRELTATGTTAGRDEMNDPAADQDVVRRLRQIPGVGGALRVARDGTVLAHDLDGDPEPAAAVTVFIGNAAHELGEALAVGFFERGAVVVGGDRTLVLEQPDWFAGLVLEERASPELVFIEARRILG